MVMEIIKENTKNGLQGKKMDGGREWKNEGKCKIVKRTERDPIGKKIKRERGTQ